MDSLMGYNRLTIITNDNMIIAYKRMTIDITSSMISAIITSLSLYLI